MHDTDGKWVGHDTLPALIDRAEPRNFQILWDEVVKIDERSVAQQQARQAADALRAGPAGAAVSAPGSPVSMGKQQTPDATPEWAQGLVADLAARGMIPGLDANSLSGATIDAPKVTIEVDGPAETGSPGTAVLRGGRGHRGGARQHSVPGRLDVHPDPRGELADRPVHCPDPVGLS